MVNILQPQPTVSHPTQMQVDGGASCHDFWYKHLFIVLFVRPTSAHVAGGSTLSDAVMGIAPVMLPTLHSLYLSY